MNKDTEVKKIEEAVPAFNIEASINQAVAQNTSTESLERLLSMRKELRNEWAKSEYDKALAAFQSECPIIERTKEGYNYKYAPIEVIAEQIKPFLAKYGLSYTFNTEEVENKIVVYCTVTHIAGHSGQPSKAIIEKEKTTKMNSSQQSGAVMTYGKRYSLMKALAIMVRDEDTDAATTRQNGQNSSPSGATALKNSVTPYSTSKGINKANAACFSCSAPSGRMHGSNCKA